MKCHSSLPRLVLVLYLTLGYIINPISAQCGGATFEENNGLVVIEAESAPAASGWTKTTRISGYTGSSAIEWTESNRFNAPGAGLREYKVQIKTVGTFRFQWRSRIGKGNSNTEHNDAWLKIPDATSFFAQKVGSTLYPKGSGFSPTPDGSGSGGWFKVYQNQKDRWSWQAKTSDNDAHDIYASFASPGVYTIQVSGRSNGFIIDRMVLSHVSVSASSAQSTTLPETLCSGEFEASTPPPPPPPPPPTSSPTPNPTPVPTPNPTPVPTPSPTEPPVDPPTPPPVDPTTTTEATTVAATTEEATTTTEPPVDPPTPPPVDPPTAPPVDPPTPPPVDPPTPPPVDQIPPPDDGFKFYMNAGGQEYVDASGNVWIEDLLEDSDGVKSFSNITEILGTESDALFQTERYTTLPEITYNIPVPVGSYEVTLWYAEIYKNSQAVGKRVFDVSIEGTLVDEDLDIFSLVGGYRALQRTTFVTVVDGVLSITLIRKTQNPKLSAIQIIAVGSDPDTPPPTPVSTTAPPETTTTTQPPPPPETTTTTQVPPPETSITQAPPPPETTTQAPPPPETTTTTQVPPPETSTTQAPPPPETTTQAPPPPETTTTQAPPPPQTTSTQAPPPPGACSVFDIDFSSLAKGEYVGAQFQAYGLTLSAMGGEGDTPRVFDTADPVDGDCGDPDLGAPNAHCAYPGLGEGEDGEPDGRGPNCVPLGNALIVQEPGSICPDDNVDGGIMEFKFDPPADFVESIGLLDIDYTTIVKVTFKNDYGATEEKNIVVPILGDNSYQLLKLQRDDIKGPVSKIKLIMTRSGAVPSITYCSWQN